MTVSLCPSVDAIYRRRALSAWVALAPLTPRHAEHRVAARRPRETISLHEINWAKQRARASSRPLRPPGMLLLLLQQQRRRSLQQQQRQLMPEVEPHRQRREREMPREPSATSASPQHHHSPRPSTITGELRSHPPSPSTPQPAQLLTNHPTPRRLPPARRSRPAIGRHSTRQDGCRSAAYYGAAVSAPQPRAGTGLCLGAHSSPSTRQTACAA